VDKPHVVLREAVGVGGGVRPGDDCVGVLVGGGDGGGIVVLVVGGIITVLVNPPGGFGSYGSGVCVRVVVRTVTGVLGVMTLVGIGIGVGHGGYVQPVVHHDGGYVHHPVHVHTTTT
jgi:hypothetical protein